VQLQFKASHVDLFFYFHLLVLIERDWKMVVGCFKVLSCTFERILMTTMKDDSNVNEHMPNTGSQHLPYTILIHAPSVSSYIQVICRFMLTTHVSKIHTVFLYFIRVIIHFL